MALVKGTNSYVDVAEADAYFENRLDSTAWTSVDSVKKQQALITATGLLDELTWIGSAVSDSQALAFPRFGTYLDPKFGFEVSLETVPERIERATFETALHLLTNEGLRDQSTSVGSISIASISLDKISKPSSIPLAATRLVACLRVSAVGWWRAN